MCKEQSGEKPKSSSSSQIADLFDNSILANLNFLVPVEDDYLLLDYYYGVVWRASLRKRVQRDYDYLDYFVSASPSGLILSSMLHSGHKNLSPEARL